MSNNLLKKGQIIRTNQCFFYWCLGKKNHKLQMHHEDYTKPDWIIWLCGSCHHKYHAGSILGPKDLIFNWNWKKNKKYNPKYYHLYQ